MPDKQNFNCVVGFHLPQDPISEDNKTPCLSTGSSNGEASLGVCLPAGIDSYNAALTGDKAATLDVNCGLPTGRNGVFEEQETQYIVRRLTPLECERLQGYPDGWTVIDPIKDMSDAEYDFWKSVLFESAVRNLKVRQNEEGVFEVWRQTKVENDEGILEKVWENTHKPYKNKNKSKMVKWYNKSFIVNSEKSRYKALGNSIAIPPWTYVLQRLSLCCGIKPTMASLFDGIGGFPYIWESLNGKGSCVWASEIEEFPIAVTKYHFPEVNSNE